jgi:hypothetical protein
MWCKNILFHLQEDQYPPLSISLVPAIPVSVPVTIPVVSNEQQQGRVLSECTDNCMNR